ncbi:hypothetical protein MO867_18085 [Microbulbifer sp. OS29]|uniref:Uncharacterized protein n=1 Tax=Microbulbifer okhotskensis TaxID=2926617 RepID=A0A9X2EPV2_9GAMM|nr:hypothetical protein [Microbulbifer okhotskensis]MCO1336244.1 hypothetical protein [Microbulbifer okhotskensis]
MQSNPDLEQPLLAKTFDVNCGYFSAVERIRQSLLWLSARGSRVMRMQVKEGRVLIEIHGPVNAGVPPQCLVFGGEDYRCVELYGCQVLWRHQKTNGELTNDS